MVLNLFRVLYNIYDFPQYNIQVCALFLWTGDLAAVSSRTIWEFLGKYVHSCIEKESNKFTIKPVIQE